MTCCHFQAFWTDGKWEIVLCNTQQNLWIPFGHPSSKILCITLATHTQTFCKNQCLLSANSSQLSLLNGHFSFFSYFLQKLNFFLKNWFICFLLNIFSIILTRTINQAMNTLECKVKARLWILTKSSPNTHHFLNVHTHTHILDLVSKCPLQHYLL